MTALLTPFPKFRAFTTNGTPLAGGKLYSYVAGTTTPKSTYTDATGLVPNANPVVLDANGEANVWLIGTYKLVLQNASDVEQWTVDGVGSGGNVLLEGQVSTTLSAQAGASVLTAASLVPAGARVTAVFVAVTTAFGTSQGLSGFDVGGMGVQDGWGANIALTLGTTTTLANFRRGDLPIATTPQSITLSAVGGAFDGTGAATLTVTYQTSPA